MSAAYSLSGPQAGAIATRGRQLLRRRVITPHQYALLDTVLWAARKPGSATLIASLHVLAQLAGQARSTVTESIRRLEELGLLQLVRRTFLLSQREPNEMTWFIQWLLVQIVFRAFAWALGAIGGLAAPS